jgi:hypothetical protein
VTRSLLVILWIVSIALDAGADPQSEELKQQGLAAARQKDWELARQRFEASYALDPRPLTLYNLAAAQENTGKLLAARTSYRTFLDTSATGGNDRFRGIARAKLANLELVIPTLRLRLVGFGAAAVVQLDGHAVAGAELTSPIAVDPGTHVAVATEGPRSARREVGIGRGDHAELELTAPAIPDPTPVIVSSPEPRDRPPGKRRSVLASGWFWGITAVVVGAAAGGYYLKYGSPFDADPSRGTLGRGVIELP